MVSWLPMLHYRFSLWSVKSGLPLLHAGCAMCLLPDPAHLARLCSVPCPSRQTSWSTHSSLSLKLSLSWPSTLLVVVLPWLLELLFPEQSENLSKGPSAPLGCNENIKSVAMDLSFCTGLCIYLKKHQQKCGLQNCLTISLPAVFVFRQFIKEN